MLHLKIDENGSYVGALDFTKPISKHIVLHIWLEMDKARFIMPYYQCDVPYADPDVAGTIKGLCDSAYRRFQRYLDKKCCDVSKRSCDDC